MFVTTPPAPVSRRMLIAGWSISALPVLLLLFSASMKFTNSPEMTKGFDHLGWPVKLAIPLAITEIACTLLYLIPRTSVLGAILLTGYLGGAIATHVRIEEQFFAPAAAGVVLWLGLFIREPRLQALIPLRR